MSIQIRNITVTDSKDPGAARYRVRVSGGGSYSASKALGRPFDLGSGSIQGVDIEILDASNGFLLHALLYRDDANNLAAAFLSNSPEDEAEEARRGPDINVVGFTYDDDVSAPTTGSRFEVEIDDVSQGDAPMKTSLALDTDVTTMTVESQKKTQNALRPVRKTVFTFAEVSGGPIQDVTIATSAPD